MSDKLKCVDGGTCHHKCKSNSKEDCFRQDGCVPLGNKSWDQLKEDPDNMFWIDSRHKQSEPSQDDHKKLYNCAVCGAETANPKTLMHNDMHRYVCSSKCMADFYLR